MKVVLAGDHYTVELKQKLSQLLKQSGHEVKEIGSKSKDDKVALVEIIPPVAEKVKTGEADFGILACGTGVGVEIGANRIKGIRASLCRDAEQAKNARVYDDANVLCLGSWYEDNFEEILYAWLENSFDRNEKRVKMLQDFDKLAGFLQK